MGDFIGPVEAQIISISTMLISAIYGSKVWHIPVAFKLKFIRPYLDGFIPFKAVTYLDLVLAFALISLVLHLVPSKYSDR